MKIKLTKAYIILLLLLLASFASAKNDLGNCNEYSDYYIYKCQAFKCKLSLGKDLQVWREMETVGYQGGLCIHKYNMIIRHPKFPATSFKNLCKLSERGRLEMAELFTKYKKGDIEVYLNPPFSETLSRECEIY
jgi:hypothetical protein